MRGTTKYICITCSLAFALIAVLAGRAALTFVPESKVQFTSLALSEPNQTGCSGRQAYLNIDMRFDCQFKINMPKTKLPPNWETPLALSERWTLLLRTFSRRGKLPMGIGCVSIPVETTGNCKILVDDKTTYNVVPGSPLAVAEIVDENGSTCVVYVSAKSN